MLPGRVSQQSVDGGGKRVGKVVVRLGHGGMV